MASDPTPVSRLNEPVPPDNVRILVRPMPRPLHAGVTVPREQQREVVRLLYVATRNQAKALIATLELEGLE